MKTVSVVLCTFNGEKYLREQLDSIVNQTYSIYELIIQDDCSTDSTIEIIKEYAKKYPFIRYYVNDQNKGYNENFFSAMMLSRGEFIAISDQDDIWELNKLEIQVAQIGDAWLSSGFSKPFTTDSSIKIHFDRRMPNYTLERMIYVGMTPGHTLLIRRKLISIIPDLDKWIHYYTYDKILQMVAAAYDKVQFCNTVLVNNRRHLEAVTYGPAENYKLTVWNIIRSVIRTFLLYKEVKPAMKDYFQKTYEFISSIQSVSESRYNAKKMSYLQSQSSFLSYLKLTRLCVLLRDRIFHTVEKNQLRAVLRAIYFPISCSDYFRYKSKNFKR